MNLKLKIRLRKFKLCKSFVAYAVLLAERLKLVSSLINKGFKLYLSTSQGNLGVTFWGWGMSPEGAVKNNK